MASSKDGRKLREKVPPAAAANVLVTDTTGGAFDTLFALLADEAERGPPLDPMRRGIDAHSMRLAGEVERGSVPGMQVRNSKGGGASQGTEDVMDPDVAALLGLHDTPEGRKTLGPYLPRRHRGGSGVQGDVVPESLYRERSPAWTVQPGEIQILAAPARAKAQGVAEERGGRSCGDAAGGTALPAFFTMEAIGVNSSARSKQRPDRTWREARREWVTLAADETLAAEVRRVEQLKSLLQLKREHFSGRLDSFLARLDAKMWWCERQEDLCLRDIHDLSESGQLLESRYLSVMKEEVVKAEELSGHFLRSNWSEEGNSTLGSGASRELVRWEVLMASIEHGNVIGRGARSPFTYKRVMGDMGAVLAVAGGVLMESGAEYARRWGRPDGAGAGDEVTKREGDQPRIKVIGVYKVDRLAEADSATGEDHDETFVDFVEAAQKEVVQASVATAQLQQARMTNPPPRPRFVFPMGPIISLADDGAGATFASKFPAEASSVGVEVRSEFALSSLLTSKVLSWLVPGMCHSADARVFVCVEEVLHTAAKLGMPSGRDAGLGFEPPAAMIAHAASVPVVSALSNISSAWPLPSFPGTAPGASPKDGDASLLKGIAGTELAVHAIVFGVALHFVPARVMHLLQVRCPAATTLMGSAAYKHEILARFKVGSDYAGAGVLSTLHIVRPLDESAEIIPLVPAHLSALFDTYVARGVAPTLANVWASDSECREPECPHGEQLYSCVISCRQTTSGTISSADRPPDVPAYVMIFEVSPELSYHHRKALERFAATDRSVPTVHRERCYHMLLRDYHPNERRMIVGQLCNWKGCRLPSYLRNLPMSAMLENNHAEFGGALSLPLCKFHHIMADRFPGGPPRGLGAGPPSSQSVQNALLSRPSTRTSAKNPGMKEGMSVTDKKSLESLMVDGFVKTILSSSDVLVDLASGEAERGLQSTTLVAEDLEGMNTLSKPAVQLLDDDDRVSSTPHSPARSVMRKIHDSLNLGDVPDGANVPVGYLNSPWQTSTGRVLVGQKQVEGAPAVLTQRTKLSRDRLKLIQPAHLMSGYSLMCDDIEERLNFLHVELAEMRQLSQEYRKLLRKPGRNTT